MIRPLPIPRTARLVVLAALVAGVLVGCSAFDSTLRSVRYPAHLSYPARHDLLVKDKPGSDVNKLDAPGELEEHMRRASAEPGAKMFDPAKLDRADARALNASLAATFGTPRNPRVAAREGTEERDEFNKQHLGRWMGALGFTQGAAITDLDLDLDLDDRVAADERNTVLARGSALYRRHCLHCHGLAGDGRGPTGPWVHPHPRDYRQGQFKFMSTGPLDVRKPRRADLLRVLRQGIDGTSMPSFALLPDHELEYLVSYVIHLSLRGEVEYRTMLALLEGGKENLKVPFSDEPLSIDDYVQSTTAQLLVRWAQSNTAKPHEPPAYTEPATTAEREASIRRGHRLFTGKDGQCIACHKDYGRQVPYKYDVWGTLVRPANLTAGTYRGGRRPIDIYWRIRGGIEPSGMPAAVLTKEQGYKPEDYWDLVNFVRALPYPAMLPEDVRTAVYGGPSAQKKPEGKQARLR